MVLLMALAGCAEPKYVSGEAVSGFSQSPKTCAAQFQASKLCLNLQWEKAPTETEYASFLFFANDPASPSLLSPLAAESVEVELWMPSMGHGSAKVFVEPLSPHVLRASHVSLYMKGEWEIRFRILKNGVKVDEAKLLVTL